MAASRQTRIDRILDALAFETADEGKDECQNQTDGGDGRSHVGYMTAAAPTPNAL